MKSNSLTQSHYDFTPMGSMLLAWLFFVGASYKAGAEDKIEPELPIYETEEIAAPKLEARIRKHAEKSGLEIPKFIPMPAETNGKVVNVSAQLTVKGTGEEVRQFLAAVGIHEEFHNLSAVTIDIDRKDPKVVQADLIVNAWYVTNEKAAGKTKKWAANLSPKTPAMEIYADCVELLGDRPVKLSSFSIEKDSIRLSGEGQNSNEANRFAGKLFQDDGLNDYNWVWETRPKYNTKKKDGTVEFAIVGQLKAAKKKEAKREKKKKKSAGEELEYKSGSNGAGSSTGHLSLGDARDLMRELSGGVLP